MWTKYGKIARDLREGIADGTYPPGSKLPAITELMASYDVARDTVRDAIAALANEGLVTPRSGIGTVVRDLATVNLDSTPTTPHPTWSTTAGTDSTTITVEAEWVTADQEIANRLQIAAGAQTVRRLRHYYKGRDVALIHEQWVPDEVATGIKSATNYNIADRSVDQPNDLYSLMHDAGQVPTETTEVVTCRMPDPNEKDVMNMAPGIPVQLITRVTRNAEGVPLETSNFAGCADRTSQTYTVAIPSR